MYLFVSDSEEGEQIIDVRLTELKNRLKHVETINHERELDLQDLRRQLNVLLTFSESDYENQFVFTF